jgi:hypothetical protein
MTGARQPPEGRLPQVPHVKFFHFFVLDATLRLTGGFMATTIDDGKLKEMLKAAVIEALEERRDLVKDIIEEAMEDIALVRAIEEGVASPSVSRDDVFALLEAPQ